MHCVLRPRRRRLGARCRLGLSFQRGGAIGRCLASASAVSLLTSALLGAVCGFLATGIALYAAGRRAINRQISDERAQLASHRPVWSLLGIDFLILAAVAAVEWYQRRHGGFECAGIRLLRPCRVPTPAPGHVPIGVWLGGVLLLGRVVERVFAHLPLPRHIGSGRPLGGP